MARSTPLPGRLDAADQLHDNGDLRIVDQLVDTAGNARWRPQERSRAGGIAHRRTMDHDSASRAASDLRGVASQHVGSSETDGPKTQQPDFDRIHELCTPI